MVSQITLGNFFNINGRNVLGGVGGSGLDTQALINSLAQARALSATRIKQDLDSKTKVAAAFNEYKQLLTALQTAADALRNPPGVNNFANNAFAYTSVGLSANKSVAASSYLSVTAAPGSALQNYTITEISSLAAALKQSTGEFLVADGDTAGVVVSGVPAAGQFKAGTFTVKGQAITLETTDTLTSIAQKFNAVSSNTNLSATVVKVSDGHYVLTFSSTQSGTANAVDLNDTDILDDDNGVFDQITITDTQDASDAHFKLDGIAITRSTNVITDVVDGLTLSLIQTTPTGELPADLTKITVAITPDTNTAHSGIVSLVNAYNALRAFVAKQTETTAAGTYADTAVLATNQTFRTSFDAVTQQLSAVVAGLANGAPNNISSIGITFGTAPATATDPEIRGVLNLDSNTLLSKLASNFNAVRDLFQFNLISDSTSLRVFQRTAAIGTSAFTLAINPTAVQTSGLITSGSSQTSSTVTTGASQVTGTFILGSSQTSSTINTGATQVTGTISTGATQTTSAITVADANTAIVFDSPAAGQLQSGVITLNGQTITLNDGDTLNNVVTKFNAVSGLSGVTAQVKDIGGGQFKLAFTSTSASIVGIDLSGAAVDPSGVFGDFTFTTTTGANSAIVFSSPTGSRLGPGTVTLAGQNVNIAEGDSLNDIIAKFNAVSGASGVRATLVAGAANEYTIKFSSGTDLTGIDLTDIAVDPAGVFGNLAITTETGADAAIVFDTPSGTQLKSGTITIGGQDIVLEEGDTLNDVLAKFNASSADLKASLINVAANQFKLAFTAADADIDNIDLTDAAIDPDGVFSTSGITFTVATGAAVAAVYDTPSNGLFSPGTITLNGQNIVLAAGDTLADVITKFNAVSGLSGVRATLVTVGDGQYKIKFTSATSDLTGIDLTDNAVDPSGAFDAITLATQTGASAAIVFDTPGPGQLQSGTITIGGQDIEIEEGDTLQDIADKFNASGSGITANLLQVAANQYKLVFNAAAIDITGIDLTDIAVDPDGVFGGLTFTTATEDDTVLVFDNPEDGQLGAGTITLAGQDIEIEAGDTLADILQKFNDAADDTGVTASLTQVANGQYKLVFTSTNLDPVDLHLDAASVDPDDVFGNFSFTTTASYKATYNNGAGNTTIDLTGSYIPGNAAIKLTGQTGTVLEGLVLVYGNVLPSEIDITLTQGVGDLVYNSAYGAASPTGTIATELDSIAKEEDRLNKDIERINQQVSDYRDYLLNQFGALEAALSRVNLLLGALQAQEDARRFSGGG